MERYHGIIVDVSQKDESIFHNLKILGQKKTEDGEWTLYKIGVETDKIDEILKKLQENMVEGFYFHFYKNKELIVVFKKRIFKVKIDKSTWNKIIEYGKSLNIPEEQLDFYPCRIEDETY